jgi:hypothetical protein
MKCPHCNITFHDDNRTMAVGLDIDAYWSVDYQTCPACHRMVIHLVGKDVEVFGGDIIETGRHQRSLARPRASVRPAPPPEVPEVLAADYREASLVLSDSPKASAALSRRCLQHLIRDTIGIKKPTLSQEIDEVLKSGKLPSHLSESIDAIRNIGNFSAHPTKDTATGEILPVEPGEADWTLDVLDGLFDFYFVQPEVTKKRKTALDAKLSAAGKPPTK